MQEEGIEGICDLRKKAKPRGNFAKKEEKDADTKISLKKECEERK